MPKQSAIPQTEANRITDEQTLAKYEVLAAVLTAFLCRHEDVRISCAWCPTSARWCVTLTSKVGVASLDNDYPFSVTAEAFCDGLELLYGRLNMTAKEFDKEFRKSVKAHRAKKAASAPTSDWEDW